MNDSPSHVIEVAAFTKNYGEFTAVNELSFEVRPGEIVGLVGANGAGKTTTLRALTGILRPTQGVLRIGGFDSGREAVCATHEFACIPDTVSTYDSPAA